uniref:LIM zinc-binding domain-containing protein n=1 Tax=Trichuris muris TaxID=70415 RepID=A0A5S6Q7J4_TRIMR
MESDLPPHVNPYLFQLDVKRPKPLAHDWGAGFPCNKCKDLCPGLELHFWRKICMKCKCSQDDHNVIVEDEDPGKLRIGRLFLPSYAQESITYTADSSCDVKTEELVQHLQVNDATARDDVPCLKLSSALADQLATLSRKKNKSPNCTLTSDSTERRRTLNRQIPLHDFEEKACNQLDDYERMQMVDFVENVRRNVIGEGQLVQVNADSPIESNEVPPPESCNKCKVQFSPGEVAVVAGRLSPSVKWHLGCFSCKSCDEPLADLIYFLGNDGIYCGRHYSESVLPRCSACDEIIFAKQYTMAEDCNWHTEHFCCFFCDKSLGGLRYVFRKKQPHCLPCYEQNLAKTCKTCGSKIGADVDRLAHKGQYWHATAECFRCENCGVSLIGAQFIHWRGSIFCTVHCRREAQYASKGTC